MRCAVTSQIGSDELRRLIRLSEKQFIGKFSFEKNIDAEEAFDSIFSDFAKLLYKPQTTKLAMTKENQTIGIALVDESKWDSEILGVKYGKMKVLCFHPETDLEERAYLLENLVTKLSKEGFKLVIARNPMDDVSTINALEREGAVVTDVLVTFQRDTKNPPSSQVIMDGVRISEASENDEGDAVKIARSVFRIDHFHSDQRLPNNKSDELYAKWTANSFHGLANVVLVAMKGSKMLGFITCKTENLTPKYKYGVIDLVGVANESKGKGIGTALVADALKWFSKSVSSVYVGTQSGNICALRLYEKLGFKAASAEATLHLWIPQEGKRSRKS
nr:GNAT family N-acetyltransferase [Candidatus Njordarchaeota archaeon]